MPATWSPPRLGHLRHLAPRTRHPFETTVSYTAMIRESGHKPGETVVSKGVRAPTELERQRLELADDEPGDRGRARSLGRPAAR